MRLEASIVALALISAPPVYAQGPPNVLLITVDDMNWDSVGVYSAKIPNLTPNIDRLANEGIRFEHAHVTIAICQPTRAVWMTGRYPHNSGAFGFEEIRPDVPTLVEALRDAGFRTGLMAKHGHVVPSRADAWTEIVPARELENGRSPELYYERALRFMKAARAARQPFFLMANSEDPHRPFAGSADEARMQETDAESTNPQYGGGFPPVEVAFDPGKIPVPGFLPDLPPVRQELAEYYTSVRRADETTGALLRALDDAGLADQTLVMFLSDHGIAVPFAKTNVWMHSTRTPWIVRWPGVVRAGVVDARHVVSGIDLAPTILDAVGEPALPGTDGHSFVRVLRGEDQDGFDFAFTHMNVTIAPEWYPMRSIIDRQFGYMYNAWADGKKEFFNNSMRGLTFPAMAEAALHDPAIAARVSHLLYRTKEELYDYTNDPDALTNLVEEPTYRPIVEKYRELMFEQMRASGDPELEGYEQFLRPPNVVIIFTDDQGYADVGVYGAEGFETPHLDKMAAEGIRFTDFLVTTPACSPSRAALLTGSYPVRVGIPEVLFPQDNIGLAPEEITIAELLKEKGYATAAFGKWHLGHHREHLPPAHGFDEYFGIPYSNDMTPDATKNPNPRAQRHPPIPLVEGLEVIEIEPDQTQLTRRYTERAVDFIERNRDRPFFLYLPHTMPHLPLFVSEHFAGASERGLYGDVISEIDWSVGEILGTLERLGLDEKTLVMFTSDNGPWLVKGEHGGSAGPFREGKGTSFEGGHRVPAIMRWPGHIPAGIVSDELVTAMDVFPTVARLVGAEIPTDRVIDGKDIWPILSGQPGAASPHEVFYYYWPSELRAVRSRKWKLHLPHKYSSIEGAEIATPTFHGTYAEAEIGLSLFNLEEDIGETTEVSAENPEVVKRLLALAEEAREELGDSLTGRTGTGVRRSSLHSGRARRIRNEVLRLVPPLDQIIEFSVGVAQSDDCTFLLPKGFPVDEYAAIVTHYRKGQFTTAGQRLQALAPQRVDEVFEFFRENGWPERCLLAASLLHTEMGMRVKKEFVRPDDPEYHFEAFWKLTSLVRAEDSKERFQRNWRLLMGLFYQKLMFDPEVVERGQTEILSLASGVFRGARTHFDEAVKAFPQDPEILLAAGTLFEWSGTPQFGEPRDLAKAEELYERACRLNPNDALAQLRYGTTLWKRRRSKKAATPLRHVLELSQDDELVFRAHIALGRIAVLAGNHQEAISHFRAARKVKPDWQVGSLALSHALHLTGARDESRRVLESALSASSTDENRFGWRSWETGLIERFGPLLQSMRDEVLF